MLDIAHIILNIKLNLFSINYTINVISLDNEYPHV